VSFVFYGWANPLLMLLLLAGAVVDFVVGLALTRGVPTLPDGTREALDPDGARTRGQRLTLLVSIVTNLAVLGFFKYFNFGVASANALAETLGLEALRLDPAFRVVLPLGISFSTFQSMSYTIDVYRGHSRALTRFVDFSAFTLMFPQLVAGPIVRFSEVADQLRQRSLTVTKFARGIAFFSIGLTKKVLLANPCGIVADQAFNAASVTPLDAWYGVIAYAFQIYFDFSGYSDMAIGLALMLGFVFPKNFDSPYLSQSITEFWRRWHISLSTWLRDYLYVPLGGNRKGRARTYANLAIVMLLGGLWHGAAWNFVVWGALHGGLLALERMAGRTFYAALPAPARVAATFVVVLVTWVFFRAESLASAVRYLGSMAGLAASEPGAGLVGGVIYEPYYVGTLVVAALVVWTCPQTWVWTRTLSVPRVAVASALFAVSVAILATQAYNPFIYFFF
jgi:alginate O-acetyltransferase complex protein AlgI